jgi:ABC-type transport system substrate-binding protein
MPAEPPVARRRRAGPGAMLLGLCLCLWAFAHNGSAQAPNAAAATPPKVLRYAFRVAETGFDPAQINDIYSRTVTPHIFEGLYRYDHLARPALIRPNTALDMPTVSEDFRTWTVRIRPGIHFADDPAFKGRRRELVAADYVYAFKRFADPRWKSPAWTFMDQFQFLGLAELRKQALDQKSPFDYDRPIDGIRALDRYTLQFKVAQPRPRLIETLATGDLFGAVAREAVEFYGADVSAHPVGTGPFLLKQWRRSSLIVLERNPQYREVLYDAQPAADDAEGQALLARLKGRRLPMVDRVEISIIEEDQPRWLTFLNEGSDVIERMPPEFVSQAMPNGQVAPNLARKGVQGFRIVNSEVVLTLFNMENPIVGGYSADKIALRRAIGLAIDLDREIRLVRRDQAIPAQSPINPNTTGYDAGFKSENGDHDPARARALLDMYGYVDRDADGWRDMPDGSPLVLEISTQPDQQNRQLDELWKRNMDAVQIRVRFLPAKWPENLKAARAGKLMMWGVGSSSAAPDGQGGLQRYHGKQVGGQNMARFRLPEFDAIYERMEVLPDGPERQALFGQAKKLVVAYMPYKSHVHRIVTDLAQPWVVGYRRPLFWQDWWHMVDIERK